MNEIERKFLVDPDEFREMLQQGVFKRGPAIIQAYLVNRKDIAVRLRAELHDGEDRGILCIKQRTGDSNLVRTETEFPVDPDAAIAAIHRLPYIIKSRYYFEGYEFDVFREDLTGLVLAEREYETVEQAREDDVPFFAIKEVTEDSRYINACLLPPVFYFQGALWTTDRNGESHPL